MRQRGGGPWGVDESYGESCLRLRAYRDLLRAILSSERRGKTPLARDLTQSLKRPTNTMHQQLARLEEDGFVVVEGEPGTTKIVSSTAEGRAIGVRLGALVLGSVPAGILRAVPESDGRGHEGEQLYLETWDEALPPTEEFGVFFVKGDSMIGECIRPGDRVQLRLGARLCEIEPGEICAVQVLPDYEATLKYVFAGEDEMVTLRAANPNYSDLRAHRDDVRIVGTLFGLVRTFGKGANDS